MPARDGGPVTLAYCWSHFRRRFYDLAKGGNAPIATEALERIAALYEIEAEIRGRRPTSAGPRGRQRSKPLVDALKPWLEEQLAKLLEGPHDRRGDPLRPEPLGRACAASSTTAASRSTPTPSSAPSGRLALNRKNALFAGSDDGGANWAIIASLIETCKLNGVESARLDSPTL